MYYHHSFPISLKPETTFQTAQNITQHSKHNQSHLTFASYWNTTHAGMFQHRKNVIRKKILPKVEWEVIQEMSHMSWF
jgi:hypothetical protein